MTYFRVGGKQPGNLYKVTDEYPEGERFGFCVRDEDGPMVAAALNAYVQLLPTAGSVSINFPSPVPRVWEKGDPMPGHGTRVRPVNGDRVLVRIPGGNLWRDEQEAPMFGPWSMWLEFLGPLTEVVQDGSYPDGGADA